MQTGFLKQSNLFLFFNGCANAETLNSKAFQQSITKKVFDNEHLLYGCVLIKSERNKHYSVRKLFTGFRNAALMA